MMIQNRAIDIDPRCVNLIAQLKYVRWKTGERLVFDRSEAYGHYDLVDALIILVNTIDRYRNPLPEHYDIYTQNHNYKQRQEENQLQKLIPPAFRRIRRPF
jgi:hypothetical protein